MKVLYKNKVGSLVPLYDRFCHNCIYYSKCISIGQCKKVGLMDLCVGVFTDYAFRLSSSDVLKL
jgi:hypothetical protein